VIARAIALGAFVASVLAVAHGAAGYLYVLSYAAAVSAGLPLGFTLFGRRHPGAWIAGSLIGYALTAFALWMPIAAGVPSSRTFVGAWIVLSMLTWLLRPRREHALVALPAWTPAASRALAVVTVVTLAVATVPLANVGRRDAQGNRYYRAYFTADFVWHTALTAEIAKYAMPPHNPYLAYTSSARGPATAPARLHYYWTYYLFPAVVSQEGPAPLGDVQLCLKLNALVTGVLLLFAVFLSAWAAVGRAVPVAVATIVALGASSAEGLYQTWTLWSRGVPLSELRNWNIDAVTAWPPLGGHRIDGLQRCLWYVPQHSMAYALGLLAIAVAASAGSAASNGAIFITGIALACSVAFNPLVGGIFALTYAIAVLIDGIRRGECVPTIQRHSLAILPVTAAMGWSTTNQMVEGAGGFLQFGLLGASRQHPIETLLLSLGPILLIGIAGLLPARGVPLSPAIPSTILTAMALILMYFVRLSVDQAWMAFRAGQMMIVGLAPLAARYVAGGMDGARRWITFAVVAVAVLAGAPTTVIDEYNAQDISNRALGPGFPWTIVVTRQQQAGYEWLRQNTPATAVVQMDPRSRERSTWSNIPSFAERRMAAGLPISLLNIPEYAERSDLARQMYATPNAAEAADIARTLRVDYVYVDEVERRAYPQGVSFDRSPRFEKVFDDAPVAIYRVR
jgi:hypothetical protein